MATSSLVKVRNSSKFHPLNTVAISKGSKCRIPLCEEKHVLKSGTPTRYALLIILARMTA